GGRVGAHAVGPEAGDLGLLGGARGAVAGAQRLDLVEVGGVFGAVQRRRPGGAELGAAGHGERRDVAPLREQRRREHRAGRLPLAQAVAGLVDGVVVGVVVGAQGEDRVGDRAPDRNAVVARRACREARQRRIEQRAEGGAAARGQQGERAAGGGGRGG